MNRHVVAKCSDCGAPVTVAPGTAKRLVMGRAYFPCEQCRNEKRGDRVG